MISDMCTRVFKMYFEVFRQTNDLCKNLEKNFPIVRHVLKPEIKISVISVSILLSIIQNREKNERRHRRSRGHA